MSKRTKRYGGFLIGDRVRVKTHPVLGEGKVVGYDDGYIKIYFADYDSHWQCDDKEFAFMPYQLINLTRQEECERNKKLLDEKLKNQRDIQMALDFVNEALRQTELFLSPLSPYGDPLPSPYTRDVYCSTKDYVLQHIK